MKPIVGVGGVLPSTYTLNGNEGDYASIEGSYQLFTGIYSRRLRISPDKALGIICALRKEQVMKKIPEIVTPSFDASLSPG